jgi:hypothetical protein
MAQGRISFGAGESDRDVASACHGSGLGCGDARLRMDNDGKIHSSVARSTIAGLIATPDRRAAALAFHGRNSWFWAASRHGGAAQPDRVRKRRRKALKRLQCGALFWPHVAEIAHCSTTPGAEREKPLSDLRTGVNTGTFGAVRCGALRCAAERSAATRCAAVR